MKPSFNSSPEFKKGTGVDLSKDIQAMSRLKEAAEKAKIELSGTGQTQVNLPFITMRDGQPEHLDITLTRAKFEELISKMVENTMKPTRQAMKDAGLKKGDVDKVILVGGSTRVPAVQTAIEKETVLHPSKELILMKQWLWVQHFRRASLPVTKLLVMSSC